jgi:leucyl/phenylalanyl-tRNA--protein transferase
MPVFRLTRQLVFPPPELAEDGLLAVGGDLRVERLLLAYRMGIFPWYSEDEPILWWSPDPRFVLFPSEFHLSQRTQRIVKQGVFRVTVDEAFEQVMRACADAPRPDQDGTWIMPEMIDAYCRLHEAGYAHSFECWNANGLAGGLYGISLGACFFGESMFSNEPNASKVALASLVDRAKEWGFSLIDCQIRTPHLIQMGAREISRKEFLNLLADGLKPKTRQGKWPRVTCLPSRL